MNQANLIQPRHDQNPVNIKIEVNINGQQPHPDLLPTDPKYQSTRNAKDQKIDLESALHKKNNAWMNQPSKTPQLSHTDRNGYSKQMDCLKPMEEIKRKKKRKRNSMDINIGSNNKSISNQCEKSFKTHTRGQTLNLLKKTDPLFKPEIIKKKRSFSKYDAQSFKRTYLETNPYKSIIMEPPKTQKKQHFQKSLKNIIHKIVNNELSKRSLPLSTFVNKTKSYNLTVTSRKKQFKKKGKLDRTNSKRHSADSLTGMNLVENLTSIRSMANSILKSQEYEENEMSYYSKKSDQGIHIKTDLSDTNFDEISYYEKKSKRQEQKKIILNQNNVEALNETNKLIENYLKILNQYNEDEEERVDEDDLFEKEVKRLFKNDFHQFDLAITEQIPEGDSKKKVVSAERTQNKIQNFVVEENSQKQEPFVFSPEKIRPFMSSQINKPHANLQYKLQHEKLRDLKKQEIEKWNFLLQYIKRNTKNQEKNSQTEKKNLKVINDIYAYLEKSKNDLENDIIYEKSYEKIDSSKKQGFSQDFTVKLNQNDNKKETKFNEYYNPQIDSEEQSQNQESKNESQNEQNFEFITTENVNYRELDFKTILDLLRNQEHHIQSKYQEQIEKIDQELQDNKLSEEEYIKERNRLEKYLKKEILQIQKTKRNLLVGYEEAKSIIHKNISSKYVQKAISQKKQNKIMKCLSESYLGKKIDFKKLIEESKRQAEEKEGRLNQIKLFKENRQQEYNKYENQDDFQKQSEKYEEEELKQIGKSAKVELENEFEEYEKQYENSVESPQKSQDMESIRQRLLKIKQQHFTGDEQGASSPNISYEEVEKELDEEYSDEEIDIINKEMGKQKHLDHNTASPLGKLKYLCAEDKEDIFQFIFLDLCIEIYQQPSTENKIMTSINRHITKAQSMLKKRKGVRTNLNVVKEYLKRLTSFILRTSKESLENLSVPMGPTAIEMLRYMHDSEYDIREDEEDIPTLIVPINIFDKFQKSILPTLEFEEYYEDPEKEHSRIQFLKSVLNIHNKALFDSMNQFLDHERPFGIWGKPFPWKKPSSFQHQFEEQELESKLKKSVDKVIDHCSYVCGLLVDKEESLVGNAKLSEAYIEQIKEDRLSRMLANDLVENEDRWVFYDDQQTEVLVQISNNIWANLLKECIIELTSL